MQRRFDWILFDADGTLLDYDAAESHSLAVSADSFGISLSPEMHHAYREINSALWRQFELGQVSSEKLRVRRFNELAALFGLEMSGSDFSDAYLSALARSGHMMDGAREMLDSLPRDYRLAVITNGIRDVQYGRLRAAGILEKFEYVIISEDAGAAKPSPDFFKYMCRKLDERRKDRMLVVGDSVSSDIAGGVGYGIPSVWFNPESIPNKSDVQPDWEIRDWVDLERILTGTL
ncbi:MAG: YjjG family noncanonical pyrimidine nucleotidase [Spirochaetaceae bacterium]|nr:YjjG family noncanonical pyrimidine nucleotidase [Spirochaetaceae bacterium]MDT8297238.1 YjjG family noncanonical pyrimidine nucleotidase [Spirochaetaceae bacterium]